MKKAINSFPLESSGGPDGLRPQHLSDMLNCNDSGPAILSVTTVFINMLLRGQCPSQVIPILFGANLTALSKKSGGIRPITVGCYWRVPNVPMSSLQPNWLRTLHQYSLVSAFEVAARLQFMPVAYVDFTGEAT